MASKTQMFRLLRLLAQGITGEETRTAATECWARLPIAARRESIQVGYQDGARGYQDSARARVWSVAYEAGFDAGFEAGRADCEANEARMWLDEDHIQPLALAESEP